MFQTVGMRFVWCFYVLVASVSVNGDDGSVDEHDAALLKEVKDKTSQLSRAIGALRAVGRRGHMPESKHVIRMITPIDHAMAAANRATNLPDKIAILDQFLSEESVNEREKAMEEAKSAEAAHILALEEAAAKAKTSATPTTESAAEVATAPSPAAEGDL
eukprot:TRINITY_DN753_c0_g1_i1.p1 TRINITY_DN753_c0_g1~~TRINITY_DN753_c0_g1_i1.p1  ORF type:complete len:160 (-),score=28.38 TRINITY_DN753_c0_g1_i1:151-630(-)